MEYPIFNSKKLSDGHTYNLSDSVERLKYFHSKMGKEIEDIKVFLDKNTFVGYMLAKKMAGKGTYAKMLQDVLGAERFEHISVGDIVRKYHKIFSESPEPSVKNKIERYYRGTLPFKDAIDGLLNRSTDKVSVQDELILALLKLEIDTMPRKGLFIDGLPRTTDQISYSLYFRDLINYRQDPDFFVLIPVDNALIDERMKFRRVCPICQTSRNLGSNPTKFVEWDTKANEAYLACDNNMCSGYGTQRLVLKEGDSEGISMISSRIESDQKLMDQALELHGIDKLLIRSSVPETEVHQYLEEYEIQTKYVYSYKDGGVVVTQEPWVYTDDNGVKSCTMYAAVYVLNIISQLHKVLDL